MREVAKILGALIIFSCMIIPAFGMASQFADKPLLNSTIINVIPGSPSNDNTPQLVYTYTVIPSYVEFYYSDDGGASWVIWEMDFAPGPSPVTYQTTGPLPDGTYWFAAVDDSDPVPVGAGDIDYGPWVLDTTPPIILSTTPADGAVDISIAAGTYAIEFSEAMDTSITNIMTNLPGAVFSWLDADTAEITYTALAPMTLYYIDLTGQGHKDIASNPLIGDMYKEFITISGPPPTIISTIPADGAVGVSIAAGSYTIEFSQAMDTAVSGVSTNLPAPVFTWLDQDTVEIIYTTLSPMTVYYIDLTGQGHRDVFMNPLTEDMYKDFITSSPPLQSWDMYNGKNYRTFSSTLTPGWTASDLAMDIIAYMNANHGEDLVETDITVTKYDSATSTYIMCFFLFGPNIWLNNYALVEGDTYIIQIFNNKLDSQPLMYELPNLAIAGPVTIDLYNGMNFRGLPATTMSTASNVIQDVVHHMNTTYGEFLELEDVKVKRYDSATGMLETCQYSIDLRIYLNDFMLNDEDGYVIVIEDGALSVSPRSYYPDGVTETGGGEGIDSGPEPEPKAVPTFWMFPLSVNVQSPAFAVAGVCDVAVDVEVEVGTTPDFSIGAGSEGTFTGADGVEDNFSTGVFIVTATGLNPSQTYHYRVKITNGANTIYFPDSATTVSVVTANTDDYYPGNPDVIYQAQDQVSSTVQNKFLYLSWVTGAQTSHPLALIDDTGIGAVGFVGSNLRDSTTGDYIETGAGFTWRANTMGMWDGGVGTFFYSNSMPNYPVSDFQEADPPSAFSILDTIGGPMTIPPNIVDVIPPSPSNDPTPEIVYTYSGFFLSVDIYYSDNGGASWVFWESDITVGPSPVTHQTTSPLPGDGTYYFCAIDDSMIDPIPSGPGDIEFGPWVLDIPDPASSDIHIFDMDMWQTSDLGQFSMLNSQVDVDDTYTFFTEINYTNSGLDQFYADGLDDVRIELTAWFDEGVEASMPASDDRHRTRSFQAIWQEGAAPGADIGGMIYPIGSPGTDEFHIDSWWLDPGPGDHYYVYMNITLGPQTRAADGDGFGNGASADINNAGVSFNDLDSWNFNFKIYDANFPAIVNDSYEEFGVFAYKEISTAGNPFASAPPIQISFTVPLTARSPISPPGKNIGSTTNESVLIAIRPPSMTTSA